ncbi:phytanoyl-CoA dioxygenase family protein [Oscillatoria sp. FACHB-1407]|uniref:phytanoyl-CoA dioxygenase family protein n=1 Tax=Oscillatoria sp. FACHB-1407 TaxID=2692847 RepID=UPI0016848F62|nr:phytanoyl-CoA dioxygenase family protein [Oscillatoria sp. FACHB-1407]MBD2465195.1 phytanoyl-CoA dioxygenase family protein [Oscillatoria sp. FACHB-1407]
MVMSQTTQSRHYWKNGYVVVRNVFTATEIDQLRAECDRLSAQKSLFSQHIPEAATRQNLTGATVCDRLDPVIHWSGLFRAMAHDARLCEILRDLLNDEPILFKDKLILKPPGTQGYGLHQDYAYWEKMGLPADALLTVQIAIDAANAENGAIALYPDLHQHRLPAPSGQPQDVDPTAVDQAEEVLICADPGDIVIFHSLTPHASAPNRSDTSRRTLYFIYNSSVWGDQYKAYYGDRLA